MEFDKYQREAIECDESAIVIATAGSGKTTTLIEKVRRVAQTVPPQNITCLSFMKKAANQLSDKLVKADKALKDVNARTIHSLAYNVLRDKGYTFMNKGYGKKNEWGESKFIKEVILPNYNRFIIEDCDDAIETLIEYARLRTCRMEEHTDYFEDFEELMRKANLERFYNDYILALRERKLFTFDTACSEALRIVTKDDNAKKSLQESCQYLFIDEAQDLSKDQFELLRVACEKAKIFMVGDGEQSIYEWRGGMSELFLGAHNVFKGAKVLHLPINYRSTTKIVEVGNRIARTSFEADDDNYMDAIAFNQGECESPYIIKANDVQKAVAKKIHKEYSCLDNWSDIAVLGRTNKSLTKLKTTLYKQKIPCRFNEQSGLPPEIALFCNYLRLILDSKDDRAFLEVYNKPVRYIGAVTIEAIKQTANSRKTSMLQALLNAPYKSKLIRQGAIKLYDDIIYLSTHKFKNAAYAIKDLFRKIDFKKAIEKMYAGDKKSQVEAIENLKEFVEDASNYKTLKEYANETISALYASDDDGVILSTVHGAKGLEWESVIITDFNDGMFPHYKSENINEEVHILYVAVTRAKKRLCLVSKDGNESPYEEILGLECKGE